MKFLGCDSLVNLDPYMLGQFILYWYGGLTLKYKTFIVKVWVSFFVFLCFFVVIDSLFDVMTANTILLYYYYFFYTLLAIMIYHFWIISSFSRHKNKYIYKSNETGFRSRIHIAKQNKKRFQRYLQNIPEINANRSGIKMADCIFSGSISLGRPFKIWILWKEIRHNDFICSTLVWNASFFLKWLL